MQTPRLVFLVAGRVERRYLLLEGLRHRVLLSTVAVQAHKREEAVRLSVFRFAVGEAGKPSKPPPVRRAGVSVVPLGQCLRDKGSEKLGKHSGVLEPGLKVAGAGLDNSTWGEAVCLALRGAQEDALFFGWALRAGTRLLRNSMRGPSSLLMQLPTCR